MTTILLFLRSVKNMVQRNIFEAGAVEVNQLFDDYLEGNSRPGACIVLALSQLPLDDSARTAIEKSLVALGFGGNGCTYATLLPAQPGTEGDDISLDAQSLFLLVEGMDPLRIISADRASSELLASAYRASFPLNAAVRVFGRPAVAFRDLSKLLETDDGKQKAWALFKTLA